MRVLDYDHDDLSSKQNCPRIIPFCVDAKTLTELSVIKLHYRHLGLKGLTSGDIDSTL